MNDPDFDPHDVFPDDDEDRRHVRTDAGSGGAQPTGDRTVVAVWPCASSNGCRNSVEVTAAAVEARNAFNRVLAKRGELPIADYAAVICDECGAHWHKRQAEASEKRRETIARHVAELRDPATPPQRVAVAEDYLRKRANDGQALVRLLARARNGGSDAKPAAGRRTW